MAMRVLAVSLLLGATASSAVETVNTEFFDDAQCTTMTSHRRGLSNTCEEGTFGTELSKKVTCNGDVPTTDYYSSSDCSGSPARSSEEPSTCTSLGDSGSGYKVTCREEEVGPVAGKVVQEIEYQTAACGEADISIMESPAPPQCYPYGDGAVMMACDSEDTWALLYYQDSACQTFAGSMGGPSGGCAEEDGMGKKRLCLDAASFEHVQVAVYSSTDCAPSTRTMTMFHLLGCVPQGEHNETTSTWTQGSVRRWLEDGKVKEQSFASGDCSGVATNTDEVPCGCHSEGEGSYNLCGVASGGMLAGLSPRVFLVVLAMAATPFWK